MEKKIDALKQQKKKYKSKEKKTNNNNHPPTLKYVIGEVFLMTWATYIVS